jgi:hypothetical protein
MILAGISAAVFLPPTAAWSKPNRANHLGAQEKKICTQVTVSSIIWTSYHNNTNAQLSTFLATEVEKRMQNAGAATVDVHGVGNIIPIEGDKLDPMCQHQDAVMFRISYDATNLDDVIRVSLELGPRTHVIRKQVMLDLRQEPKMLPSYVQVYVCRDIVRHSFDILPIVR